MTTKHILVVDDHQETRNMVACILQQAGYGVTTRTNGVEALERILALQDTACQVDLVLTDMNMPWMTGVDLVGEMTRMKLSTPTIVMSNSMNADDLRAIEQSGCVGFIEKPFTVPDVVGQVDVALAGHQQSPWKNFDKHDPPYDCHYETPGALASGSEFHKDPYAAAALKLSRHIEIVGSLLAEVS
jgi:CheY-like chemotaxis protein